MFEIAWRTTRHPHPLEQIIVVGWIGVSPHRFPPPSSKGCSSRRHILSILWVLYSCLSLWFKYSLYSPLIHSLCAFAITPVLFLFILGERTGSLFGFISLSLSDFYILIFSHPSYSWFSCSILSHNAFLLGAYSVCVHRDSVFYVCTLCFFHSIFGGTSIFGGSYIYGETHLFGGLYLFGGLFARLRPGSSWHFDTSCVKNGAIDL